MSKIKICFENNEFKAEVYNTPANVFVAGFIGSPNMNFFDATLTDGTINFGKNTHSVPNEISGKVKAKGAQELVFGIRPEHIEITPAERPDSKEVMVSVIEYLGAESLITFEFSDGISGKAISPGQYPGKIGDKAYISFPNDLIHLFDNKSEKNLLHDITWD